MKFKDLSKKALNSKTFKKLEKKEILMKLSLKHNLMLINY